VTSVISPTAGVADGQVELVWTVENQGPTVAAGIWVDRVYLSQDTVLNEQTDLRILTATAPVTSVGPGSSYTQTQNVTLPGRIQGNWYVFVRGNSNNGVLESDAGANNTGLAPNTINITQPPRPNLVVVMSTDPTGGMGGHMFDFSYMVENAGAADAVGGWTDRIVASTDMVPSADDVLLATVVVTGPVAPGGGYMRDLQLVYPDIPPNLPGDFHVLVQTDREDTLNEGLSGGEADNLDVSPPFAVVEPDRPNLVVTNIITPPAGLGGASFDFTYEVSNLGPAPTTGTWTDRFYASTDQVLSGDDFEIGSSMYAGGALDPVVGMYGKTVTLTYPQVPGEYYLIVRTDADNVLLEGLGGGENDNVTPDSSAVLVNTYTVSVDADITNAPGGTPVHLSGRATIVGRGDDPAANVPVSVRIGVKGSRRVLNAMTDENGEYALTFQPLLTEGGLYSAAAAPPYVTQDVIQDQFRLNTILTIPRFSSPVVYPGTVWAGAFELRNPGDVTLTGVSFSVNNLPSGVALTVTPANTFVPANGRTRVDYFIEATQEVFLQEIVGLSFTCDQGNAAPFQVYLTVVPNQPNIVATPGNLAAEMVRGEQTILELDIENVGGAVASDLEVLLPNVPWLQLGTESLPDLDPGESATVVLHLLPDTTLPLGEYTGSIAISGEDGSFGVSVPFSFIAASDQRGDLIVRPEDEFTYWSTGEYEEEGGPPVP
ncbi:MAG: hypothetical protein KDA21_14030, partial [Phycisphaerales bacterium]|nr:hypothetical protein [Phycisphaerales bacterium]